MNAWMPGIVSASPFSYIRRTASIESLSLRMVLATSTMLNPDPSSSHRRTTDRYFPGHVTVSMRENLLIYTNNRDARYRY